MKISFPVISIAIILCCCNNPSDKEALPAINEKTEKQSFFPVTSFLKGEIFNLKTRGINPLKYTTVSNHTDSVWLKIEDLEATVNEFLHPVIDTGNLINLFTEKSFLDQSINAVTLTYEPSGPLPDSMQLKQWNVYIDPESNKVTRIYMVKEINKTKTLQLTWLSNQWCKITSIITDQNGTSTVEKEEKLFWGF